MPFNGTPPSTCLSCGSSDIEYPYNPQPIDGGDPISVVEGTPEEQIATLTKMLDKAQTRVQYMKIVQMIAELHRHHDKNK